MVALRASRLVCSAIEVITLMTSPIWADDSPRRLTVSVVVWATVMALSATLVAPVAELAISPIELPICSDAAATVEMFVDTKSAAGDAVLDWAGVPQIGRASCGEGVCQSV